MLGWRQPCLLSRSRDADLVTRTLVARGFANVATVVEGSDVFVTFENTRFRDLRRALREVASDVHPLLDGGELVLVPSVDGVPLGTARYPAAPTPDASSVDDLPGGPRASLSLSGLPRALLSAPRASSSFGRVDVVVHPWFEASFGDYEEPVRSRTGVAPEVRIALRRGLRLSAQMLFTLQDDLPTGESRIRPGLVTLSQTVRLPRNVFVHAAAGAFTPNRYGADVHARAYTSSGRWFAGGELGQTGLTSFARDGWQRSPMDSRTALVEAGWRDLRHGLTIHATAGAFLGDQQGIRLDVVRQFGEVDFGGFVTTSEQGKNGGALLRIPLGVGKHPRPGAIRLRAADAFRWEYRYYGGVPGGGSSGRRSGGGMYSSGTQTRGRDERYLICVARQWRHLTIHRQELVLCGGSLRAWFVWESWRSPRAKLCRPQISIH
jgi:hypothetical protein